MLTTAQYETKLAERIADLELLLKKKQDDVTLDQIINILNVSATFALTNCVGRHLPNLDRLISKVASIIRNQQTRHQSSSGISVILASEIYLDGGHSRIVEDIVDLAQDKVFVVLTDYNGNYLGGKLELGQIYERLRGASIVVLPNGTHISKVLSLTNLINLVSPDKLYLLLHHADSIGYTAALAHKVDGLKTFYIHHADHNPTLGATFNYDRHLDTTKEYCQNCENNGQKNCFVIPLYVKDKGIRSGKLSDKQINFASVGSENKLIFEGPLDHAARITECLKFSQVHKFVHVGHLQEKSLEKIRLQLLQNGIDSKRFEHITWVPSVWEALLDLNIHSLIATAPLAGGRTAIEAQGAGIPVLYYSDFVSSVYAIPDLHWTNHKELEIAISTVLENHSEYSKRSRKFYEKYHNKEMFKNCLGF